MNDKPLADEGSVSISQLATHSQCLEQGKHDELGANSTTGEAVDRQPEIAWKTSFNN